MVGIGIGIMVAGAALDRSGLGRWDLNRSSLDRATAGWFALVLIVALVGLLRPRDVRVAAGIAAALGLVGVGWVTQQAVGTGLPGASTGVMGVGALLAGLGTVARAFGPAGHHRTRVVMIVTVVLVVLVGGGATALAVARTGDLTVRSTVADGGVPPAPEPARPSAQAWSWRSDGAVRDVRAAGGGVAVVQGDDEVLGLDGTTGRPRWSFRRAGARLDALLVSPDRATVVAMYASTTSEAGLVTVLDATTGARRWEHGVAGGVHRGVVTDAVVATRERLPADGEHVRFRTTARAIDTGAQRWVYDSPGDCDIGVDYAAQARGVVPMTTQCPDRTSLTGLDEASGAPRWTLTVPTRPDDPRIPTVRAPGDGSVLVFDGPDGNQVVDPLTGTVRARVDPALSFPVVGEGRVLLEGTGADAVIAAAVDPRTGATTAVPGACAAGATELAVTVSDSATFRLCRAEQALAVTVDAGPLIDTALDLVERPGVESLDTDVIRRRGYLVPAAGAVVVGVPSSGTTVLVGLR